MSENNRLKDACEVPDLENCSTTKNEQTWALTRGLLPFVTSHTYSIFVIRKDLETTECPIIDCFICKHRY